jgi:hypothetical protein
MRQIRVACHVHSAWSYDGRWSLEAIGEAFGRRGYDVVLLAEHDRGFDAARWADYRAACMVPRPGRPLLVPGIEYSDPTNTVHAPVWGDIPFLGEGLETAELLLQVERVGGLAILAHPGRRDVLGRLDPDLLRYLIGVELWNRKYDGYAPNRAVAETLAQRPDLVPMVSLDFHTARQFHPLAMVGDLVGELSEAAICQMLSDRRIRPTAFRMPATHLVSDPLWPAMHGIERVRRGVAARLKSRSRG